KASLPLGRFPSLRWVWHCTGLKHQRAELFLNGPAFRVVASPQPGRDAFQPAGSGLELLDGLKRIDAQLLVEKRRGIHGAGLGRLRDGHSKSHTSGAHEVVIGASGRGEVNHEIDSIALEQWNRRNPTPLALRRERLDLQAETIRGGKGAIVTGELRKRAGEAGDHG